MMKQQHTKEVIMINITLLKRSQKLGNMDAWSGYTSTGIKYSSNVWILDRVVYFKLKVDLHVLTSPIVQFLMQSWQTWFVMTRITPEQHNDAYKYQL